MGKPSKSLVLSTPRAGALDKARTFHLEPNPWAKLYLRSLRSENSRPAQRSGLAACARVMSGNYPGVTVDNFPWHMLRAQHTQQMVPTLIELGYKPRTINRTVSAVKGVLKMAWRGDAIDAGDYQKAVDFVGMSVGSLEPAGRAVPTNEIHKLLASVKKTGHSCAGRDLALITFMYGGGLRRQEAAALDVDGYRESDGRIKVTKGKGGKFRTTYLADHLRPLVQPWVEAQRARGAGPMFCRWRRNGPGTTRVSAVGVDRILGKCVRAAGLPATTPHDLRRSFATELLDHDADILMVQELMGHASVATTKIYDRRAEKGKQKAIGKFPKFTFDEE